VLAAPLLRESVVIGVIVIRRVEVRPFSAKQIALLETFADQAVIAIENVRLFNETKEALQQQTATSDILRVISSSPTNVQPVFEAIVTSGVALFEGAAVAVVLPEDGQVRLAAVAEADPQRAALWRERFPFPLDRDYMQSLAILERRLLDVPDVERATELAETGRRNFLASGYRAITVMPMVREQTAIGAISVMRLTTGPLSDKQRTLLQTFADQAVIAIENVRLFRELETRNAALSETLEQQTATAEILRVISASPTNVQPVLDAVAESAARICAASDALIFQVEAGKIHRLAQFGSVPFTLPGSRPLDHGSVSARAIVERRIIHVHDITDEQTRREYPESAVSGMETGVRTLLALPLMRDDAAIGAITIRRTEMRPFSDKQVDLLKTFADQAVIAIENVRLFNEIQEKTSQLEAANRHKDEFLASMSHELRTPLNAVIGFSEVLLEKMFGEVNDKQEEYLQDILASGRHLLSLINDILDLAKIEAGRMELDVEEFDVAQAVDNAVVLVRERATRKGLTLSTTLDHTLGSIRGDQRKIKQVMLNLLSNAVKFTPEGGRVEVRAQRTGDQVEIAVVDTGIGIAAEDLETVFEEFRQVGTDYAKKHEGTGLGLTLSRKFVELHGGRLWVKSQLGQGSTFAFSLPGGPWPTS
jgi:signal transduction histidine kinase